MFCKKCGAKIPEGTAVCASCGAPAKEAYAQQEPSYQQGPYQQGPYQQGPYQQGPYQQPPYQQTVYQTVNVTPGVSSSSKLVALLLCIFFGALGVHRFYVGKIGTGILYLFTGGFCGIGWLVDVITIACGSFRDSYGRPLA